VHTGTFGNEDDLPRVPLPGLEDSCERFIDWCAPLLTAAELASTKRAVAEFLRPDSPAHTLQSALEQYAARDDVHSWLDEFWADRYLARRDRIALNANFFFLLEESGRDQVDRAAELVAAALDYKGTLDAETAPPAEQRGSLLSMEQHKFLFSSTRIPGSQRDTARTPYSPPWPGPSQERHIAVLFRSNLFHVEVIEEGGRPYPRAAIAGALRRVMRDGAAEGVGVGALTTKPRAEWAASRQALLECHPANQRALEEVETALLCLCLEDTDPGSTRAVCRQLLAGDPGNRWFDKAVSFVVFPDGSAGVNVEHCRLDGTTILAFDSPGWRIMRDDYLSTSSAASVNIRYFGFGATSDHCIGVAYVLLPDRLNVHLSTRRAGADEMHRFAVEFRHAVGALAGLLTPE
jgi:carnitine O-acetyltransferase